MEAQPHQADGGGCWEEPQQRLGGWGGSEEPGQCLEVL